MKTITIQKEWLERLVKLINEFEEVGNYYEKTAILEQIIRDIKAAELLLTHQEKK